jgi:DNA-binding transcriptional LysR family regulator
VELRHLRYFVAVGEEEHFGRAADRLHIVQPALTRQVQQLEDEIGCALFERLKRGVRLTEAGKQFLEESRRLLSDLENGLDRTRRVAQGKLGRLRVGFVETALYTAELPSILNEFRTSWPEVRLELFQSINSRVVAEQLRDRKIDCGFVYVLPTDLREVKSYRITSDQWVLAFPQAHRLVKSKRVRLRDLERESFVWYPRGALPVLYERVLSACHAAGVTLNIVQEGNSPTTLLSLVAGGIGLSFINKSAARMKPPNVVLREVEDLRVKLEFSAIWWADKNDPALDNFVDIVRKQAQGKHLNGSSGRSGNGAGPARSGAGGAGGLRRL